MKRKKILFFHFDLGNGGAERVLVNLANSLTHEKYEVEIRTLFNNGPNRYLISNEVKYSYVFNYKQFRGISHFLKLFKPSFLHKLFIRDKYDIEIAFREGCPSRIISGGSDATDKFCWIHTTLKSEKIAARGFRNIKEFRVCSSKFKKIAAVSSSVGDSVKKWLPNFRNIGIVYNVIDPSEIRAMATEPIGIELDNGGIVNMITVGRLTSVKSFDRLLKSLKTVVDRELVNWHLYIVGTGELDGSLRKLTAELGLDNKVTFLGYQDNPHKYVSKMDLYVCSSLIEGYSTSVTEAIINRVPVLTTDCAGMDEILADSGAGIIVENSEKGISAGLEKVLSDTSVLNRMKTAVIKRHDLFSKENSIKQFEQFVFDE